MLSKLIFVDAHDFSPRTQVSAVSPHMLSPSLRLASPHLLLSLGKGFHPGPLYPPAEASGARQAAAAPPRTGTRRQPYLNTYCVPATTVDSTANGVIVTIPHTETEPQKNSLFTQDHRVHEGARIRDQGCDSTFKTPPHILAPGGMVWVSDLSQDLLGPAVPLCLSDWLLLQTPSLVSPRRGAHHAEVPAGETTL